MKRHFYFSPVLLLTKPPLRTFRLTAWHETRCVTLSSRGPTHASPGDGATRIHACCLRRPDLPATGMPTQQFWKEEGMGYLLPEAPVLARLISVFNPHGPTTFMCSVQKSPLLLYDCLIVTPLGFPKTSKARMNLTTVDTGNVPTWIT